MSTTYETRTRTDRYGGYSSYRSRIEDDEQEEYVQTSTMFDDNETPEYEVQKNYSMYSDEDVVQEDRRVTMAMPSVIRKSHEVQEVVPQAKLKLRARGKIAITVYSIILLTLIAFAIYNAVAINQMQALVAAKNQTYITQSVVINDLLEEYNNLGSDERILEEVEGVFIEPTENHIVRVSLGSMEERPETSVESNWFEELCKFLSGLFN